jgi:hypothetical protein
MLLKPKRKKKEVKNQEFFDSRKLSHYEYKKREEIKQAEKNRKREEKREEGKEGKREGLNIFFLVLFQSFSLFVGGLKNLKFFDIFCA